MHGRSDDLLTPLMSAPPSALGGGCVIWVTGPEGAQTWALADVMHLILAARGVPAFVLNEPDMARLQAEPSGNCPSVAARISKTCQLAQALLDTGMRVIVLSAATLESERRLARDAFATTDFLEVRLSTLAMAAARSPGERGDAGRGAASEGLRSSLAAELEIDGSRLSPEKAAADVLKLLQSKGWVPWEVHAQPFDRRRIPRETPADRRRDGMRHRH